MVGAGPIGLLLALRLGRVGIHVKLLEREAETSAAPRACGYFAASQLALQKAGVYDLIREEGFMTHGLCWRKLPVADEATGSKRKGETIARLSLAPDSDVTYDVGAGLLNLQQSLLSRLLLRECLKTGCVEVHFSHELKSIRDDGPAVHATFKNVVSGRDETLAATYLVGADGGRSTCRGLLGINFAGHTWPEQLLATDVRIKNHEIMSHPTAYVMHPTHYTVTTPLTEPKLGEESLWRFTVALPPGDTRSAEDITHPDNIHKLYDLLMDGPRPLEYTVTQTSVYRIHQRLATTLRRGRCLLVGDAAHVNNVSIGLFFPPADHVELTPT